MSEEITVEHIVLDDGKYEVRTEQKGSRVEFYALRYGGRWRELTGDNLVYDMFCRIRNLESESLKLRVKVKELEKEKEWFEGLWRNC